MKVFVCIALLVASAHAGVVGIGTGASSSQRSEDGLGNYAFGYDEAHATGGTFRKESGNAFGVKVGSYGLRDADGRVRTVNYVADGAGFRASIATNEPGTAPSLPAAAAYNAGHAPVVAAASYAAPVAVAAPAAFGYAGAHLAAPALGYGAHLGYAGAPVVAKAAVHDIPAQYAANVFAPSGTPYAW